MTQVKTSSSDPRESTKVSTRLMDRVRAIAERDARLVRGIIEQGIELRLKELEKGAKK